MTTRPIAVADTFNVNEDYCIKAGNFGGSVDPNSGVVYQYVIDGVLTNDSDIDGDSIHLEILQSPSNGQIINFDSISG